MDNQIAIQIIIFIICLFFSGYFSSAETALMGFNKIRMTSLAEDGNKKAKTVIKLIENPNILLSTILIGNNLANIGASSLATSLAIKLFGNTGVGIATGVVTLLVLIFGEITPKSLAANNPDKAALSFANPINVLSKKLRPIIFLMNIITSAIMKIIGVDKNINKNIITQEDLRTMVQVSQEQGSILDSEKDMIDNVFDIKKSLVKDIMTPRTDIVAVDSEISIEELKETFRNNEYSRIPIFEENIDNIKGIIHIRDLISIEDNEKDFNILQFSREPYFIYEYNKVEKIFKNMKDQQTHMAIVLDEYGGTVGLVTLEDIVEELVGEIEDEYDIQNIYVEKISENESMIEGTTKIETINEMFNLDIPDDDYDSIGGYVFGEIGRLPIKGDSIKYKGYTFTVDSMDHNRIEYILLKKE